MSEFSKKFPEEKEQYALEYYGKKQGWLEALKGVIKRIERLPEDAKEIVGVMLIKDYCEQEIEGLEKENQ